MYDFSLTNEEIVAYYGTLTNNSIPCGDLENLLDWAGLARRDAVTGAWVGTLTTLFDQGTLGEGLEELFSHLNKPRSMNIDTTVQPWAAKMDGLLSALLGLTIINAQFVAGVKSLAGGMAHEGLTVEAVQEAREDAAAEDAASANIVKYNSLFNEHIAPLHLDNSATSEDWQAGLDAIAANWSN